jgi:DNA-directed RNA polymerase subunit beta
MTPKGTFVINGAERVIVSQLHRSPGVFLGQSFHPNGTKIYSARVIPFKGAWMEFATDINNVMYAYIDRKKEVSGNDPHCGRSALIRIKRSWIFSIWQMK